MISLDEEIHTKRDKIIVGYRDNSSGAIPRENGSIFIAQPKIVRSRPLEADFEAKIKFRNRRMSELHQAGDKYWVVLIRVVIDLNIAR